jgi:rubredoxin
MATRRALRRGRFDGLLHSREFYSMHAARPDEDGRLRAPRSSFDRLAMRKYMCLICGYIYDEAVGAPEDGIAPGTRWEDVPPNWSCPECGARKEDFELIEF